MGITEDGKREVLDYALCVGYNRESQERIHKGFSLAQSQLAELFN